MRRFLLLLSPLVFSLSACTGAIDPASGREGLPTPASDVERAKEPGTAKAVFAGGCFWCTEAAFEQIEGVKAVVSGYAGGTAADAVYETVGAGRTDHAESIEVTYDPSVRTYGELLQVFFTAHDPTELNRQGPDVGRQYRSTIFYADDEQQRIAAAYQDQVDTAGVLDSKIATTLEPLKTFYPAEEYHQDFVRRHPDHPYVRAWSVPKAAKVRKAFPAWVKKEEAGSKD